MPAGLQSAIANGERPTAADRRQMVRVLADEVKKLETNPTRAQCLTVSHNIVRQYPKSFADADTQETGAAACSSLLSQLKNRIEHLNRNNYLAHRRAQRAVAGAFRPMRGPTDTYGCTSWQPELATGETDDSLEEQRKRMEELFLQHGVAGGERGEVNQLMESTYCLQRRMINATPHPTIVDLRNKWPFLFIPRGIYTHFQLLTDKDVRRLMEHSMIEWSRPLIEYFKQKPTNKEVQSALPTDEANVAAYIVQLLLAHFKESKEGLVLKADATATAADVQQSLTLPTSPRLIVLGETQSWMLSIEGQVVCEGTSFLSGLAALFASYYNFNLQYQDEAACTLEFIQRCFIDINPERGTKTRQGKGVSKKTGREVQKKAHTVNPHVATLLRKLMDFKCFV
ncbi:hypothetical protein SKAU_G00234420 [Synaphobranchus kaupii]|uniref:Uncharacterized protein n=1 Tax=Synaphobranchus kaupii TaxID=118154 RepID=A0A9Q1F6Q5_SYNKA|nr:hypothetical protein SKAU_G00234420 [Synaphobranchus kaupii]